MTLQLHKHVLSQAGMSAHAAILLSINGKWRKQAIVGVTAMAVAQSQGFHSERLGSQPAREALGLHLNREAAAN